VQNTFAAGAQSRTPVEELTALPSNSLAALVGVEEKLGKGMGGKGRTGKGKREGRQRQGKGREEKGGGGRRGMNRPHFWGSSLRPCMSRRETACIPYPSKNVRIYGGD